MKNFVSPAFKTKHVNGKILDYYFFLDDGKMLNDPFPNKPWFIRVCRTGLLKTLWEKEKLLVTSNFSFSRSVFYLFGELSANFLSLKLSSAKAFFLEESKICLLGRVEKKKGFVLSISFPKVYNYFGIYFYLEP